jgi:tRNA (adenine37-N6)-methyltransferase
MNFTLTPIGHVRGGRAAAIDDHWGANQATIELDQSRFTSDALLELDSFSHAEVVFIFDKVSAENVEIGARHPRGRRDWPRIGIFAQRGKNRPNRLGVTVCQIVKVDGTKVLVRGLDAIDGTPVLDIKPVMREFMPRGEFCQPHWVSELMANYWESPKERK